MYPPPPHSRPSWAAMRPGPASSQQVDKDFYLNYGSSTVWIPDITVLCVQSPLDSGPGPTPSTLTGVCLGAASQRHDRVLPLPSEEGTSYKVSRTFTWKPRPETGRDCVIRAIFARQQNPEIDRRAYWCCASDTHSFSTDTHSSTHTLRHTHSRHTIPLSTHTLSTHTFSQHTHTLNTHTLNRRACWCCGSETRSRPSQSRHPPLWRVCVSHSLTLSLSLSLSLSLFLALTLFHSLSFSHSLILSLFRPF